MRHARWARPRDRAFALALLAAAEFMPTTLYSNIAAAAPSTSATASPAASGNAARALTLYRESTKAYDEGRFQAAVNLLLEAYALHQEPVILFNLARAYEGLGDLQNAIDSYARYLERDPNASDRKSIEQRIATLHKQLEDMAALEKQRDEERSRAAEARQAAMEAERVAELEQQRANRPSVVPWVIAGTGVLGIGVGVVLGALSHGQYEDAVKEPFMDPAKADAKVAQTYATGANAAFVAGGILAAAGTAWGLVELARPHKRPVQAGFEIVVAPAFGGIAGRF